jgi:ferredoxin
MSTSINKMYDSVFVDSMIKKLTIEPGCITCGVCSFVAPDVFEVTDISHIKEGIDLQKHKLCIMQAVEQCPVQVIVCDKDE